MPLDFFLAVFVALSSTGPKKFLIDFCEDFGFPQSSKKNDFFKCWLSFKVGKSILID